MSWSVTKIGRALKLAETIAETFAKTGGCYSGSETTMKNQIGVIAAEACASLPPSTVVKIEARGSAGLTDYNDVTVPKYKDHYLHLEISTLGVLDE